MITVLICVKHGPEALAVTLSTLVPAVAAGLIGDAVILAGKPDDTIGKVADAAGATLIVTPDGSWKRGAQAARRDWLLCLDDGDIPQEGWIRVLDRFVSLGRPEKGMARLRRRPAGFVRTGIDALLGRLGIASVRAGDLVHRRYLMEDVKARAPVRLAATIERDPVFR
jgi:hypothetical protein